MLYGTQRASWLRLLDASDLLGCSHCPPPPPMTTKQLCCSPAIVASAAKNHMLSGSLVYVSERNTEAKPPWTREASYILRQGQFPLVPSFRRCDNLDKLHVEHQGQKKPNEHSWSVVRSFLCIRVEQPKIMSTSLVLRELRSFTVLFCPAQVLNHTVPVWSRHQIVQV